ncbi:AGC/PKG protein kinase [Saprolegnia diclina VS20]|uniref:cGMP-dependent protein kinase n=1 Tax=Saprolegnia diclina (strain VS20) TaxID=1156394 RepID=T0SGJ8_SAPDV|nr:AGC/PKG protein kinase [Saprolegnia diclina VS20]EQC42032.1 AGC/PKG protein kinase [Saprolegnia diclina VS20]|eukprot:XP_008604601.1 AGC/PKG protein kinase [Saprolegnia diclina VS20]
MGGGSSTQQRQMLQLQEALQAKEAEVAKLRELTKELDAAKAAKESEVGRAVRTSVSNTVSIDATRSQKSHKSFAIVALPKPADASPMKRRVEVSAEIIMTKKVAGFEKTVFPKSDASRELILKVIQQNILFNGLSLGEQNDCVDAFMCVEKPPGVEVITQGDQGDHFYVVQSGTLDILVSLKGNAPIKFGQMAPGMGFGELALLCNTPRAATIKSTTPVVLWALDRLVFRNICTYHESIRHEKAFQFLRQVSVFDKLSSAELTRVAAAMQWEEYSPDTVLLREGEVGDYFYLITSGEVCVSKRSAETQDDEVLRYLTVGEHFGEMALFKDETRSATCTSTSAVQLLTLAREHFCALLGSLQELMERSEQPQAPPKKNSLAVESRSSIKYAVDVELADLEIMQTLGSGAFGRVKLVQHRPSHQTFALKCLVKSHIVSNNLKEHVVNEKRVMMMLDHPFILKLHHTYKDAMYVYFLLELALGGELFTFLRRREKFDEASARFYIASVVLAFEHMHTKAIAYRDLKPENLILDARGFLKVVDFGLAKVVNDRTWTLCGTPDYLAPEIILNRGHDKAVDYWALGILIYELIAGTVPFYADDPMQVYSLVLTGNIKFPVTFGRTSVDLIQKLLTQNPVRRLGNLKHGVHDIMNHRWFSGYDWDGLLKQRLTPPIVPQLKSNVDASYFERIGEENFEAEPCSWDPDF